jgi:RNA polymerase sigma-70 factor (ECF subfamily)
MTPLHLITALAASASAGSLIAQVRMAAGQNNADPAFASTASPRVGVSAAVPQEQSAESRLVERICAGEKELFYELVRPYERAVYVAAFSVLHNEHDAEEVAQEAVLKAFTHLGRFRGDAKFSTWIIQIAINEARMKLRKDRRHLYDSIDEQPENEEGDYKPRDFADWREIPSEALERTELRDALKTAIASLSPKYREVFMLRDVQNVSITDTAKALGITEASVKTRLLRARLQLRDALAPGIDGVWSLGEKSYRKVRPW